MSTPRPGAGIATVTRLGHGGRATRVPLAEVQGTLALDLAPTPGPPTTPELRVVPDPEHAHHLHPWAARFAQAVVEVLGGDRPVTQLVRWTSPEVYDDLTRRASLLARAGTAVARRRVRPQVRSVHVFCPTANAAEISAHVRHGNRSRAVAARLELQDGCWRCTVLQLG